MSNRLWLTSAFCLQLLIVVPCLASGVADDGKSAVIEKPITADTPEKFADTAARVHRDMAAGGRYEFIKPDDKIKVESDLGSIDVMLRKSGSVTAMSDNERLQLFNTQEHLNGILTHSDANRVVCERRAALGSNLPTTTCRTVGDIERSRIAGQKALHDLNLSNQRPPAKPKGSS